MVPAQFEGVRSNSTVLSSSPFQKDLRFINSKAAQTQNFVAAQTQFVSTQCSNARLCKRLTHNFSANGGGASSIQFLLQRKTQQKRLNSNCSSGGGQLLPNSLQMLLAFVFFRRERGSGAFRSPYFRVCLRQFQAQLSHYLCA